MLMLVVVFNTSKLMVLLGSLMLVLEHLQELCKSTLYSYFFLAKSQKEVSNGMVNLVCKFPKCVNLASARTSLRARLGLLSPEIIDRASLSRARASAPALAPPLPRAPKARVHIWFATHLPVPFPSAPPLCSYPPRRRRLLLTSK
jgi:hypothetical protein